MLGARPASAASDPVEVQVNMARILRISAPAATVIIGNPAVADVTIQDPQTLVLTGKSFGDTNLIVLDAQGNPIADTIMRVVADGGDIVTVFLGAKRTSVACSPTCQPVIRLGDDAEYAQQTATASQTVSETIGN
jgi:Flp pilus assembly secretin CpaC